MGGSSAEDPRQIDTFHDFYLSLIAVRVGFGSALPDPTRPDPTRPVFLKKTSDPSVKFRVPPDPSDSTRDMLTGHDPARASGQEV